MSIKILFLLVVVAVCSGIGWKISNRISSRRKYFEDLILLLNTLISDMRFSQTNLSRLLVCACPTKGKLKVSVDEFLLYVDGKTNELTLSKLDLTDREYEFVKEMFSTLGRYDLDSQVYVLTEFKRKAEEFYSACKEEENKKGKASKKLGIMAGLAIGLILL